MKKFFKILTILLVLPMLAIACKDDELVYEPGSPESEVTIGVYFPQQDAEGSHTLDPEAERKITVKVSRSAEKSNGAAVVPFTLKASSGNSDESELFQAGEIAFEDGQTETELVIDFPNASEGVEYDVEIILDDPDYVSVYGKNPLSLKFSILIVTWQYILNPQTNEPSLFTITQNQWNEVCFAYIKYYEVNGVLTCFAELTGEHIYNGESYQSPYFWGPEGAETQLQFRIYPNALNPDGNMFVELPPLEYYYHSGAGAMIYFFDYYYFYTTYADSIGYHQTWAEGMSWLDYAKKYGDEDPLGYYDGNGGLYFYIKGRYMLGLGGWDMDTYDIVGLGEGFVRTDYSLKLESDYTVDGETPVFIEAGADVAKVKYAVYEGELTAKEVNAQVSAIDFAEFSDFKLDEEKNIQYATLALGPDKTGIYTIVVLAYDSEDTLQESASVSFKHVAADDMEKYEVQLGVFTEDTPARYQNYHDYDSFAYCVLGQDLTEVHVAILTEDQFTDLGPDTVIELVKKDEAGNFKVPSGVLKQINGEGGFYTVIPNVKANTTFYVVVWGTNGSLDAVAYDTYTTQPLPYVWNSLGKGTLTDGLLMPDWEEEDVTVACDVYEEENTPGLYMVTGFQLELAAAFYGVEPSVIEPYEGENGNWWNANIIIDATNPESVTIEAQQYGIYTTATYQYALIASIKPGTLADGAITFPADGLLIGYTGNGKYYYGNPNGTFKITLPEAQEAPELSPRATGKSLNPELNHANSKIASIETPVFQRDPKPVKVNTKVNYTRKEQTGRDLNAPIETGSHRMIQR